MHPSHPIAPLAAAAAVVVVVGGLVLGACGDQRSPTERFCAQLREDAALLSDVPATPEGLQDLVARYRELEDRAPLAIEEDWRLVTDLVEETATADLADPEVADVLRERALAATRAVERITAFARTECGVELGTGVVPGTVPGTVPPSTG